MVEILVPITRCVVGKSRFEGYYCILEYLLRPYDNTEGVFTLVVLFCFLSVNKVACCIETEITRIMSFVLSNIR